MAPFPAAVSRLPVDALRTCRSALLLSYRTVRDRCRARALSADVEVVFTDLIRRNAWRGSSSVSGAGSDPQQTRAVVQALPELLRSLHIRSLLDVPCGDFDWMREVDLGGIEYLGADIVAELVEANRRYESQRIRFTKLNLLADPLPRADLVLCRDCLVHFSFADAFAALANVCRSGATYFLTTTFVGTRWNRDIRTGQWRAINLCRRPFDLPEPLALIDERCSEDRGAYADKALALWKCADIAERLPCRPA